MFGKWRIYKRVDLSISPLNLALVLYSARIRGVSLLEEREEGAYKDSIDRG